MIQSTATIYCFIACKILTLKYKYLVLFIKRLWAGSAYSKSLQKNTLLFQQHTRVGGYSSNNVPCWYWKHLQDIISNQSVVFEDVRWSEIIEKQLHIRHLLTKKTHLFPPNYWLFEIDTNSHNPSLSLIIPLFFCTGIDSINLIFVFSYINHYCMLVFL